MGRSRKTNPLTVLIGKVGIVRIAVLALVTAIGAWYAFALAASGVTRIKNPEAALQFMPADSTALAARADQMFFANAHKPPKAVEALARQALRSQAINAKALRLLGYYADARGDTGKAEQYVRQAAKLSRREPGTQLWLIEASARSGNISQTLVHYDIALRTKPDTQTILFPRLLQAIEDKEIRAALKPYIRKPNGWAGGFFFYATQNSKNPSALVDLVEETGGLPDGEVAKNQELALLNRLAAERNFLDARRLYLNMPGARAIRLTNASFDRSDRSGSFGPLGWQLIEDPDAGAGFSGKADDDRVMLMVYANASTTRTVASKLLYLSPGEYVFMARLASLARGDRGFLRWQLRCPSDPSRQPIWVLDSISSSTRATFSIPSDCPVQSLDLIASGGKGQTGLEATVANASIAALE